ncbi:MAG: hypothetical protein HY744_17680 [Deltaproteobacteria bacterium]|nr:hypothetical protein [Deltaproteobacteria bacterium]
MLMRWRGGWLWLAAVALPGAIAAAACDGGSDSPAPTSGAGAAAQGGTGGAAGGGQGAAGDGQGAGGSGVAGSGGGAGGGKGGGGAGPGCVDAKFKLTQQNPEAWDFYELCVLTEKSDAETILKGIDPKVFCGVQGAWAQCDPAYETGCHGELEYVGQTKVIADAKWAQLCEMSTLDFVTKIVGGHLVN